MEENKKVKTNIWALLSMFWFGVVVGFFISPIKKGIYAGNNSTYNGTYEEKSVRPIKSAK